MYIDQKYFDSWMQRLLGQIELVNKKVDRLGNKDNVINDEILLDNQDLCLLLKVSNVLSNVFVAQVNFLIKELERRLTT